MQLFLLFDSIIQIGLFVCNHYIIIEPYRSSLETLEINNSPLLIISINASIATEFIQHLWLILFRLYIGLLYQLENDTISKLIKSTNGMKWINCWQLNYQRHLYISVFCTITPVFCHLNLATTTIDWIEFYFLLHHQLIDSFTSSVIIFSISLQYDVICCYCKIFSQTFNKVSLHERFQDDNNNNNKLWY